MKTSHIKIISFLFATIFGFGLYAQDAETEKGNEPTIRNGVVYLTDQVGPHALSLEIVKLSSNDGKVMLTLMTEEKEAIAHTKGVISDKTSHVLMDSLPAGTYVVRYYHDENDNGKLDTGAFGIPTEGYGSSNDARGFMGPPSFEDMIFELNTDVTMKMKTVN